MLQTAPTTIAAEKFERLEQAWNRADGAAFGDAFADETDFVNIRGEHHRGDGALIGRAHQGIFDSIYAGSRVRLRVDIAREIAPGTILAVVSSTLDVPSGPMRGVNNARITAVITEQDDGWAIEAFHNTLVREGG
jgi:uncharacterized protein (TIGR02246 family)